MNAIPKWGPRLARLLTVEVRQLEAQHAARMCPGATSWETAIEGLYQRAGTEGPVKGAQLIRKAADYLNSAAATDHSSFIVLSYGSRSRRARLVFASYSYGPHPNPAIREEGLTLTLHQVESSRIRSSRTSGATLAYISRHALNRLFERGDDLAVPADAAAYLILVAVLGLMLKASPKHVGGGMHLVLGDLLLAGTQSDLLLDIRTALSVDTLSPRQYAMLEQGQAATAVAIEWLERLGDAELEIVDRIPQLARYPDSYPARVGER